MNAKYIYWELSHYCKLRCKQCFARANNDASTIVDREVLFNAINKVADANMSAIRFGGGEPLMVPTCSVSVLRVLTGLVWRGILFSLSN